MRRKKRERLTDREKEKERKKSEWKKIYKFLKIFSRKQAEVNSKKNQYLFLYAIKAGQKKGEGTWERVAGRVGFYKHLN